MGTGDTAGQVPQELLDKLHMTRQEFEQAMSQFNAVQGTAGYNPFALGDTAETGTLWLGQQEKKGWQYPGLPETRPGKSRKTTFDIYGHKVEFITPDYGDGYKYEWHTAYGTSYLHANQLDEVRENIRTHKGGLNGGVRIFLVVKDSSGKQVDVVNLDADQTNAVLMSSDDKQRKKKPDQFSPHWEGDEYGYWAEASGPNTAGYAGPNPGGAGGEWTDSTGQTWHYVWHSATPPKNAKKGDNTPKAIRVTSDPYAENKAIQDNGGSVLIGGVPMEEQTGTIQGEMEKLYDLSDGEIRKLKTQLWLAGYYPSGTKLDEINMRVITNEDISAFGGVMVAAARYYAAGEKKTWRQLLSEQATDPSAKHKDQSEEPIIPLTDPVAITQAANALGTKVLGRAPSAEDVQAIVAMIHEHELSYGKKQNEGGGEGVVDTSSADSINANMEQYMRQHYPNEAMAVDWGSAAQQWDDLLMSSSPQPPIVGAPRA